MPQWGESFVSTASANRYPIGFGRLSTAPTKIGVNVEGTQVATIGKPSTVSTIDTASKSFLLRVIHLTLTIGSLCLYWQCACRDFPRLLATS